MARLVRGADATQQANVLVLFTVTRRPCQVTDHAVRIATFNINGINKRLANLLAWLDATRPDVVCLQELKAEDRAFPIAEIEAAGYSAVWHRQRTRNGVAILLRVGDPVVTRNALPGVPEDAQARYIEAAVNGVLIASIYAPNGNPNPGAKFDHKLAWLERLIVHAAGVSSQPCVLAGDFNVVPTEADIYQPNRWAGDALVDPAARAAFATLLDQGWVDALRALHPDVAPWTFCHTFGTGGRTTRVSGSITCWSRRAWREH